MYRLDASDIEHVAVRTPLLCLSHNDSLDNSGMETNKTKISLPFVLRFYCFLLVSFIFFPVLFYLLLFSTPCHFPRLPFSLPPLCLSYLTCFPKVRLCDFHPICLWIPPPINFWISEPVFMKLGLYVMATEPVSTSYFINPSNQSLSIYVSLYPVLDNGSVNTFPRQRIHAKIE
jgi:hypothetical protein